MKISITHKAITVNVEGENLNSMADVIDFMQFVLEDLKQKNK